MLFLTSEARIVYLCVGQQHQGIKTIWNELLSNNSGELYVNTSTPSLQGTRTLKHAFHINFPQFPSDQVLLNPCGNGLGYAPFACRLTFPASLPHSLTLFLSSPEETSRFLCQYLLLAELKLTRNPTNQTLWC